MSDLFPREFREMAFVPRYGIVRVNRRQYLAEHSYFVCLYAMTLAEELRISINVKHEIIAYAIMHDAGEMATTDMAAPAKRMLSDDAKKSLDNIERDWLGSRFPLQSCWLEGTYPVVKALVKVADMLESLFYMATEYQMGNNTLGIKFAVDLLSGDTPEWLTYTGKPTGLLIESNSVAAKVAYSLVAAWANLRALFVDTQRIDDLWPRVVESFMSHAYGTSRIIDDMKD